MSRSLKGVSPLVATVLLIAFVVAVAGIIAAWTTGFAKSQTAVVEQQSTYAITCGYGSINMKSLVFQSSGSRLAGTIENNGQISLGNITLRIVYQNATSESVGLCSSATGAVSCSVGNLSMMPSDQSSFNVTIWGGNYDTVRITTNCSTVSDSASRGDVA